MLYLLISWKSFVVDSLGLEVFGCLDWPLALSALSRFISFREDYFEQPGSRFAVGTRQRGLQLRASFALGCWSQEDGVQRPRHERVAVL